MVAKIRHLRESFSSNMRIVLMSTAGKIGLSMLLILLIIAGYVIIAYYPETTTEYTQGVTSIWPYKYPFNAPPCWSVKNKFKGLNIEHDSIEVDGPKQGVITIPGLFGPKQVNGIKVLYTAAFNYTSNAFPSDVLVSTVIHIGANITYANVVYVLERPDGSSVVFFNSTLESGKDAVLYGVVERSGNKITAHPLGLRKVSESDAIYNYFISSLKSLYNGTHQIIDPKFAQRLLFGQVIKKDGGREELVPLKGVYHIKLYITYIPEKNVKPYSREGGVNLTFFEWKLMPNCYGFFGTDNEARPIGLGLVLGVPYAFLLGFTVTFVSTFIGALYGTLAGYWKDIKGEVLMRVADVVNSLPFLPILIVLSYVFRQSITLLVLAGLMIVLFWAGPVIIVRSTALQISEQLYIEAAKASGVGTPRIIFRHIFPQILPYTIAIAVLSIPGIIVTEAGLSLLGFGDPTAPTWGKMLQNAYDSQAVINGWWWTYLFPGLALVVFSATFLLIGRAIEPIVAPKLQK